MRLPKGVKLTPFRRNILGDLVNACAMAEAGARSERDFDLCCWAVRTGADQEIIWAEVQDVGKFAERGRAYFDRTWDAATGEVRGQICEKHERAAARNGKAVRTNGAAGLNGQAHHSPADPTDDGVGGCRHESRLRRRSTKRPAGHRSPRRLAGPLCLGRLPRDLGGGGLSGEPSHRVTGADRDRGSRGRARPICSSNSIGRPASLKQPSPWRAGSRTPGRRTIARDARHRARAAGRPDQGGEGRPMTH